MTGMRSRLRNTGVTPALGDTVRSIRIAVVALCVALMTSPAQAQPADGDWQITVYPILGWLPLDIGIEVNLPSSGGGDGGGGGGSDSGPADIVDSRFDGAFFGGVAATNGPWRIEGYGLWAAFGGDRPERPFLDVDVDLTYGSAKVGRRIAPDFYVTGGVRRLAIAYDVTLGDLPTLSRKPGVWDPIVGIGWHRVRDKVEWHASFDGGGFGVGADVDLGASFSVDWKPVRHFGLTAGYNLLYLKVSDEVANRDLTLKLSAHGPTLGFGLYF